MGKSASPTFRSIKNGRELSKATNELPTWVLIACMQWKELAVPTSKIRAFLNRGYVLFPTAYSLFHFVVYAIPNVLRFLHSCCTKAEIRIRLVAPRDYAGALEDIGSSQLLGYNPHATCLESWKG